MDNLEDAWPYSSLKTSSVPRDGGLLLHVNASRIAANGKPRVQRLLIQRLLAVQTQAAASDIVADRAHRNTISLQELEVTSAQEEGLDPYRIVINACPDVMR